MLTIISFLITIIGAINWLLIGLLQYDFVAGIFGYQASVFSRLIYIIIGVGGIMLFFKMIKGKGTIAVFSKRNKDDLAKNINKKNEQDEPASHLQSHDLASQKFEPASALNIEASHEVQPHQNPIPQPSPDHENDTHQNMVSHEPDAPAHEIFPSSSSQFSSQENHSHTTDTQGLFDENFSQR